MANNNNHIKGDYMFNTEERIKEFSTLLSGLWDKELPDIIPLPDSAHIDLLLHNLDSKKEYSLYNYSDTLSDNYIKNMKNIKIYNGPIKGAEPSLYFSYKNSDSLRQMGVLNLFFYISFVYNALAFKGDFYVNHYLNFQHYENSLSPIFANTDFYVTEDFYGRDIDNYVMNFLVGIFGFDMMKDKTNDEESDYIYSLHLDVSNFYQNIYTHIFDRIGKEYNTFSTNTNQKIIAYFEYLDKYNQQSNLSQTKGIIPGTFSSTLCAELFMCEIDNKIANNILLNKSIGYLRNVDDMTFYSDSKEELENILNQVQILLNTYKLSINDNKTKLCCCAFEYEENMLDDVKKAVDRFCDNINSITALENLKAILSNSIKDKRYIFVKSVLTYLKTKIKEYKGKIDDPIMLINYLIKLSLTTKFLGSRCLKIVNVLLEGFCDAKQRQFVLKQLLMKIKIVDITFSDSIVQIWFYYLINKYSDITAKASLLDHYKTTSGDKNPFILTTFINSGDGNNKELFRIIKEEAKICNDKLFFTKYSLPLIGIYNVDKYSYQGYLKNKPEILSDLYD